MVSSMNVPFGRRGDPGRPRVMMAEGDGDCGNNDANDHGGEKGGFLSKKDSCVGSTYELVQTLGREIFPCRRREISWRERKLSEFKRNFN